MNSPIRRPRTPKGALVSGMEAQNALIEANTAAIEELTGVLREMHACSVENATAVKSIVTRLGKMAMTADGKLRTTVV